MSSLIIVAGVMTVQAFAQQISFEEAVRRASDQGSERERAQLAVAVALERYLESQSKFRWEWRPRLGLLSFSNPVMLASSLGLGLSIGRNQPPESVRQNARLDSLAAEVGVERAAMKSRLEVSRLYFEVLQREEALEHLAQASKAHQDGRRTLDERTKSAHLTAVNRSAWDLRTIGLEADIDEAEDALANAKTSLAALIGTGSPDHLQLAVESLPETDPEIPSAMVFRKVVFARKKSRDGLRDKLVTERKRGRAPDGVGFNSISLAYSRLNDHRQPAALIGQGTNIVGSHTGIVDLGVKLPVRKTGEEDALKQYASARLRSIEVELDAIDEMLARELERLRSQVIISKRKAEAAARRMKIVAEMTSLIADREQTGLETGDAVINADAELIRARYESIQAKSALKIQWLQLTATCTVYAVEMRSTTMVGQMSPAGSYETAVEPVQ